MSGAFLAAPAVPSLPTPSLDVELGLRAALTQCRQGENIYGQETPSKLNSFNENLQNTERLVV